MDKCRREAMENLLRRLWTSREEDKEFVCGPKETSFNGIPEDQLLSDLAAEGLITRHGGNVELTEAGDQKAANIVRRLRLAERLYCDLLQGREEKGSSFACRFEHILNDEVTDSVCTLLGHPPTCPHGRRIPPGRCCQRAAQAVRPVVKPLSEFAPGSTARIVFLSPKFHHRLDRLNSFGILPGAEVQLHQKQPTFVLRIGATEVAIENEVAREIFAIKVA